MAPLTTLNLCSGYDGLGLALDIATGGQACAVCHVEIEVPAAAILAHAMESGALPEAPIWSDLRTFDALPWRGVVDIVVAGYPCQPFSVAGKRGGESDPRHLWPEVARIMGEVQPAFGFFENVSGHLVLGFDAVCEDLERLGYRVAAGVFTASEVGASHRRERLFILAHREDERRRTRRTEPEDARGFDPAIRECAMADASRLCEHGPERPRSGSVGRIREAGQAVGNADAGGLSIAGGSWDRSTGPQNERCAMGDPCECGQCGQSRRRAGSDPENGPGKLADCESERTCGARTGAPETGNGRGDALRDCRELFPPGPSDPRWGRIIEQWPDLAPAVEPSLCRVVDGRPARVDQLRMLGNGVVPLQGAYAFCALSAVLGFGEGW